MTNSLTFQSPSETQLAYVYSLAHLVNLNPAAALKFKNSFPSYDSWNQLSPTERESAAANVLGESWPRLLTTNFDHVMENAIGDLEVHKKQDVDVIPIDSDAYPHLLKQISDAPLVIFAKGSIKVLLDNLNVAVVGTRDATHAGEKVAHKIAKWLAEHRWCVVSGLAKGIDSAAHRGTLEAKSPTVAVMATPLNKVYPAENKDLANEILDYGGCWISELPLWKNPHRGTFVQRDRIQSGLSVAVVPVQTDVEGGTMHTVRYAEEQKRLLLCPQPIEKEQSAKQYAGIMKLIATHRAIAFSSEKYGEILEALNDRRKELLKDWLVLSAAALVHDLGMTVAHTSESSTTDSPHVDLFGVTEDTSPEKAPRAKKRKKKGQRQTETEIQILERIRDEIRDGKPGAGVNIADWLDEKIKTLRNHSGTEADGANPQ